MNHASRFLARGTPSSARVRSNGPSPVIVQADGAEVTDADGNVYVDFVLGLGPAILGHRPPGVVAAVTKALADGVVFGGPNPAEGVLAELLVDVIPSAAVVALVSTGSEAVHLALRISRSTTRRRRVIKFDGHYHGWIEPLFVNPPWGPALGSSDHAPTHGVPGERPPSADEVTVLPWNDLGALASSLAAEPPVAAVFMEPIHVNCGVLEPEEGFLAAAKELCRRYGALLVFDEVLTGFRMGLGGAQERLGVEPDLTICSKAVASGLPLALVAGSETAMSSIAEGPVKPAGTFSGSPVAVAGALATISELSADAENTYSRLDRYGCALAEGIRTAAEGAGAPLWVNQVGSAIQLLWGVEGPVETYERVRMDDRAKVAELTEALLAQGVHVGERGLMLISTAHSDDHIDQTSAAFSAVLQGMSET
jgi:glutamate-1-semialdehyde 2,1-aminomutase